MDVEVLPQEAMPGLAHRLVSNFRERLFPTQFVDELTGLGNRAAYNNELDRKIYRQPGNFALLMIDLDGLKEKNDTYGHDAGDALIKEAALSISHTIRVDNADDTQTAPIHERRQETDSEGDLLFKTQRSWLGRLARRGGVNRVFRWGGDEFPAILDNVSDPEVLASIIKRINKDLAAKGIYASIGGALHQEGMSKASLSAEADDAMYAVKNRNKVEQKRAELAAKPHRKQVAYYLSKVLRTYSGMRDNVR